MNSPSTDSPSLEESDDRIVLFDGDCNLCHSSVNFLIRNDTRENLKFASLQSESGRRLLHAHGVGGRGDRLDSVVFIERGKVYTHSEAALRIVRHLDGVWPLLAVFRVLPGSLRYALYRFIARNRYRWFGKSASCRVPTPELLRRFLT